MSDEHADPSAADPTTEAATGSDDADAGSRAPTGAFDRLSVRLNDLRTDTRQRRIVMLAAGLLGLAVAWIHWLGLAVGGALVGLAASKLRWAVVAALAFGAIAIVVTVLVSPLMSVGEFLALTPVVYVTIAAGLGLAVLGSLVRGVV